MTAPTTESAPQTPLPTPKNPQTTKNGLVLVRCQHINQRKGKPPVRCSTPICFIAWGNIIFKCHKCKHISEFTLYNTPSERVV